MLDIRIYFCSNKIIHDLNALTEYVIYMQCCTVVEFQKKMYQLDHHSQYYINFALLCLLLRIHLLL